MKYLFLGVCLLLAGTLTSQHHDNIWPISSINGSVMIDFSTGEPIITDDEIPAIFWNASTYISNEIGQLQLYTDGCKVYNAQHDIMLNGYPLNPGNFNVTNCNSDYDSYPNGHQGAIIVPRPKHRDEYVIFHKSYAYTYDSSGNISGANNPYVYYTTVDMEANNGSGAVIERSVVIDEGNHELGALTSVKHANGTDWWIISPLANSNEYGIYLLDSTGVTHTGNQATGITESRESMGGGQSIFSPDGQRYLRFTQIDGLQIWDFNRQTGLLSNFQLVPFPLEDVMQLPFGGIGLSPSGRYAYVSNQYQVFQYDLEANSIVDSRILIAEIHNNNNNLIHPTLFNFQLGPDCKLYGHNNSGDEYHVIHNPDEPGLDCNFEQAFLIMPFPVFRNMPHFPNYRLGPVGNEGSPCAEPLISSTEEVANEVAKPIYLTTWPNPATTEVALSLSGLLPDRQPTANWSLYNADGRLVAQRSLQAGAIDRMQRPRGLAAGLYHWVLIGGRSGQILGRGKLVWQ